MNYGFNGFKHSFQNFGYSQRSFSSRFYKNLFKNKSVFNAFNSNLNKGKCLINMSNKYFMDRVQFLSNNSRTLVNCKTGNNVSMFTGEENVADIRRIENDEMLNLCKIELNKFTFLNKNGNIYKLFNFNLEILWRSLPKLMSVSSSWSLRIDLL